MEEKSLIFKAKKNDQKAFNILFNKNWDYLYNFQLKRVGNNQIAEEISIETFAKAFDKLESFNNKYKSDCLFCFIWNHVRAYCV